MRRHRELEAAVICADLFQEPGQRALEKMSGCFQLLSEEEGTFCLHVLPRTLKELSPFLFKFNKNQTSLTSEQNFKPQGSVQDEALVTSALRNIWNNCLDLLQVSSC